MRPSVVVVGGGIAGLCAAWELSGGPSGASKDGPRIEVIEAQRRLGGLVATTTFADRVIDLGADGFLSRRPEVVELVHELGRAGDLEEISASGASLFLNGALRDIPAGMVLGVPTSTKQIASLKGLSRRALWSARRDQWRARSMRVGDDATIGEITRRKLGSEIAYRVVEPMIGGIQAGRIDDLSAASVFPQLLAAARRSGSLMKNLRPTTTTSSTGPLFCSLRGGVGSLVDTLSDELRDRGVVIRLGTAVTGLRRTVDTTYPWEVDTSSTTTPTTALVVATPCATAGQLLREHDARLAALTSVDSASTAMITLSLPREHTPWPPGGTGVLVPLGTTFTKGESFLTTAITLLDHKWPRLYRSSDVVVRVHVGRSDDTRFEDYSDVELTRRVVAELAVLMGRCPTPLASLVQRWPQGLPQYRIGHGTLVGAAKSAAASLQLALAGNAYDGVGLPACVGSGRRAGREALAMLRGVPTSPDA